MKYLRILCKIGIHQYKMYENTSVVNSVPFTVGIVKCKRCKKLKLA